MASERRRKAAAIAASTLLSIITPALVFGMIRVDPSWGWPLVGICVLVSGVILIAGFSEHHLTDWRRKMWPVVLMAAGFVVYLIGAAIYFVAHSPDKVSARPEPKPALLAVQVAELREIDQFIGTKSEVELRDMFDFDRLIHYNLLVLQKSEFPGTVDNEIMTKAERYFKGGVFIISGKYNDFDGSGHFTEKPGALGGIKLSPKYSTATQKLESYEMSATVPTDVRAALKEFHDAIDNDVYLLLDVLNEQISGANKGKREALEMSPRPDGLPNLYWHRASNLRPKAQKIGAAIRVYLRVN